MKLKSIFFLSLFVVSATSQSSIIKELATGEKHTIHSKILNEKRDIFVYVPKGFWGDG